MKIKLVRNENNLTHKTKITQTQIEYKINGHKESITEYESQ